MNAGYVFKIVVSQKSCQFSHFTQVGSGNLKKHSRGNISNEKAFLQVLNGLHK